MAADGAPVKDPMPRLLGPTSEVTVDDPQVPNGSGGSPRRRRRHRRVLLATLAIFSLVGILFIAATLHYIVFPPQDQPRYVDGIVSFNGPDEGARTELAISLTEKGYAPVLLFSRGSAASDSSCPTAPRIKIVCFVDASGNTRGEAEWAGRYAEQHDWHSLMIVPGRGQATRARLLTERCFSGQVVVVPAVESRPPLSEIVHEWGGLFDALVVHRSC